MVLWLQRRRRDAGAARARGGGVHGHILLRSRLGGGGHVLFHLARGVRNRLPLRRVVVMAGRKDSKMFFVFLAKSCARSLFPNFFGVVSDDKHGTVPIHSQHLPLRSANSDACVAFERAPAHTHHTSHLGRPGGAWYRALPLYSQKRIKIGERHVSQSDEVLVDLTGQPVRMERRRQGVITPDKRKSS